MRWSGTITLYQVPKKPPHYHNVYCSWQVRIPLTANLAYFIYLRPHIYTINNIYLRLSATDGFLLINEIYPFVYVNVCIYTYIYIYILIYIYIYIYNIYFIMHITIHFYNAFLLYKYVFTYIHHKFISKSLPMETYGYFTVRRFVWSTTNPWLNLLKNWGHERWFT